MDELHQPSVKGDFIEVDQTLFKHTMHIWMEFLSVSYKGKSTSFTHFCPLKGIRNDSTDSKSTNLLLVEIVLLIFWLRLAVAHWRRATLVALQKYIENNKILV